MRTQPVTDGGREPMVHLEPFGAQFLREVRHRRQHQMQSLPMPPRALHHCRALHEQHPAVARHTLAQRPGATGEARKRLAANLPPASFATTPYFGVNAFRFQGADGQVRIARWVFEPRAGLERLTAEQLTSMPADFLADELRRRVATAPVEFDMVLQFPGAGDDVNNPTIAWPDDRPRTMVGRLTVTEVAAGPGGACEPISFMVLDQEPGITFSDDPMLAVRAGAYAVSLSRRTR
jgi:catalase